MQSALAILRAGHCNREERTVLNHNSPRVMKGNVYTNTQTHIHTYRITLHFSVTDVPKGSQWSGDLRSWVQVKLKRSDT